MDQQLATICEKCSGVGTYEQQREASWKVDSLCDSCNGAGLIPTEFGKKLLDLVKRFIRKVRVVRPHAEKTQPLKSSAVRTEWGRQHTRCMACGAGEYGTHVLTTHELIGGRGGRSQEPCNWLRLGMHPCHDLATGLDVRGRDYWSETPTAQSWYAPFPMGEGLHWSKGELLPKITLAIAIQMKMKCGELTEEDLGRLEVLNGKPLPDPEEIPQFFQRLWKLNLTQS